MLHVRSEDVDSTLTSRGTLDDLFNHFILVSFDLRFQSVDGKHLSPKWARVINPATNLQTILPSQKEIHNNIHNFSNRAPFLSL